MVGAYLREYLPVFPADALVASIPLHPERRRMRGFNQSELIANHVSAALGMQMNSNLIMKVRKTHPQVGLPAFTRRDNIAGSFIVSEPALTAGKTIILLDDVKTTGATIEEAAHMLKKAGARRIIAVTVAH